MGECLKLTIEELSFLKSALENMGGAKVVDQRLLKNIYTIFNKAVSTVTKPEVPTELVGKTREEISKPEYKEPVDTYNRLVEEYNSIEVDVSITPVELKVIQIAVMKRKDLPTNETFVKGFVTLMDKLGL